MVKSIKNTKFSTEETNKIVSYTKEGLTNQQIADNLNRTLKSITSKKDRLVKENKDIFKKDTIIYRSLDESIMALYDSTHYELTIEEVYKKNKVKNKEEFEQVLLPAKENILNEPRTEYNIYDFLETEV